ncbi:MAG: hypothetical protein ACP5P1_13485 [Acidimicrobiales bacterium]
MRHSKAMRGVAGLAGQAVGYVRVSSLDQSTARSSKRCATSCARVTGWPWRFVKEQLVFTGDDTAVAADAPAELSV